MEKYSQFTSHIVTRLNSLFEDFCSCFNEADFVGIMEVYSAGGIPLKGHLDLIWLKG